jgi:hypothetical protein
MITLLTIFRLPFLDLLGRRFQRIDTPLDVLDPKTAFQRLHFKERQGTTIANLCFFLPLLC